MAFADFACIQSLPVELGLFSLRRSMELAAHCLIG